MLDVMELAGKPVAAAALEDFDEIVRLHQQRIYRLLLGQVGDPTLAEDLTQECFVRAYQSRAQFRGEAQLSTWLVRIAVNLARDYYRNRRMNFWKRLVRSDSSEEDSQRALAIPDHGTSPEQQVLQREKLGQVMELIKQLSPPQRETLLLSVMEEMSLKEIAQCTNRRLGTVKTHLYRALMNLRRLQEGKKNVDSSE
jgi:RNA polymerase sigma-70 factor, ECF subfamily